MEALTLKYPVQHHGETIQMLNIRRPRVADIMAAEKQSGSDVEQEIAMAAKLCDVAPDVIHQLDLSDFLAMQEIVKGFTGSAHPTPAS